MKSSVVIAALESFGASTTALCFVDMPPSLLNSTPPRHFAAPSAARGRVGVRRFLSAQTPGDMGVMCQLVSSRRSGLGKGCTEGGLGRDSFSWARARLPGDTTAGGGDGARRRSTRLASGGRGNFNSVPGYKRGPPDDDEDIWSRGSVFEFRSLNDPDTNASRYDGLSGQASPPSARRRAAKPKPTASEPRPTAYADEEEDAAPGLVADLGAGVDDWFQFSEKEPLFRSRTGRSEVERVEEEQLLHSSTAAAVELATQLGLPASATYDELRAGYRVDIKRCHPDMAGDNEFRGKLLERRFQRLTAAWDAYVEERQRAPTPDRSAERSTETKTSLGETQAARDWARTQAKADQLEAQIKARAAAVAMEYSGKDRDYLDVGGSSC